MNDLRRDRDTLQSDLYTKPFRIEKTSIIKARAFQTSNLPSAILTETARTYDWMKAAGDVHPGRGIGYRYFQPEQKINMISAFQSEPVSSGITDSMTITRKKRMDKFALEFSGYIKIDKEAIYNFFTQSDDGSKLFIDDVEIVNNDGDHGLEEKSGKAALRKGFHKIMVLYFDSGGGNELHVLMQTGGGKKTELSAVQLFH